jgi:DNA/RNA endonuclease YhcR with UshA esterase domain
VYIGALSKAPDNALQNDFVGIVGHMRSLPQRLSDKHSSKGNIFLNMGVKYPNQAFTAWIPSASAGQFSNPQQYEGQTVSVSGKITLYHGKPEIIVNSPSQISAQ